MLAWLIDFFEISVVLFFLFAAYLVITSDKDKSKLKGLEENEN